MLTMLQHWVKGMLIVIGVIVAFTAIGATYYQARLARRRDGWPRDRFVAEFERVGVPPEISGAVYNYYCKLCVMPSYRVAPDDSLERVYGASDEELEDAAKAIIKSLGIQLPEERVLREWPTPLKTVCDMVLWTNWVRSVYSK
jgi:hypothetical protein